MIYIKISDQEYYDDSVVMIKSFYPRNDVAQLKADTELEKDDFIIEPEMPDMEGMSRSLAHDTFKKALYIMLSDKLDKKLPWGFITGVRPSKFAYIMIEDGYSEDEIIDEFTINKLASLKKASLALDVAKRERELLKKIDFNHGYSLYIGIPFCPTTCLYCSFTSYSVAAYKNKVNDYLDALIKEMKAVSAMTGGKGPDTIYFGGGTPTTLEAEQLDRLLLALEENFDTTASVELTVEAGRPDSITKEKLKVLKKHGVDRISINPQTMNQETLDTIGRRHTVEQVVQAFKMAREYGFSNINMDTILGLPGEGIEEVKKTFEMIKELNPESLTVHSLAIKRAAALNVWREKFVNLKLENSEKTVDMAAEYAHNMGMEPYYMYRQKNMTGNFENVGYSVPGKECIYNILIMEEKQTIIALGAGASTKVVFPLQGGNSGNRRIERVENVKNVDDYITRIDEMIGRKQKFFQDNKEELKFCQ